MPMRLAVADLLRSRSSWTVMRERLERKLELEFEVEELRDGADPIRCPKGWEDGVSRFEEGSRSTRLSLDLLRLVSRGLLRES